jgi:glycosyltransferase involved in cell wall biosynthesis
VASQFSDFYRDCDFTVYPSLVKGFGLPIVESLWNCRPCICANFGEMAEIAKEGVCL